MHKLTGLKADVDCVIQMRQFAKYWKNGKTYYSDWSSPVRVQRDPSSSLPN